MIPNDQTPLEEVLAEVQQTLAKSSNLAPTPASSEKPWSAVELTPAEQDEAVSAAVEAAKQAKYWRLQDEDKREKQRQFQETLTRPFNPNEQWDYAKRLTAEKFGVDLVLDDENRSVVQALTLYFTNDPRFEELKDEEGNPRGWKLDRGLLLQGDVGTGKTLLMKAMSRNKRACYDVVKCETIAEAYAKDGDEGLARYLEPLPEAAGDPRIFYQRMKGWCLDDVGVERVRKHFGNECNVVESIIYSFYDLGRAFWPLLHMTSNLPSAGDEASSADTLETHLGTRAYDRMRQMFNILTLPGASRR